MPDMKCRHYSHSVDNYKLLERKGAKTKKSNPVWIQALVSVFKYVGVGLV